MAAVILNEPAKGLLFSQETKNAQCDIIKNSKLMKLLYAICSRTCLTWMGIICDIIIISRHEDHFICQLFFLRRSNLEEDSISNCGLRELPSLKLPEAFFFLYSTTRFAIIKLASLSHYYLIKLKKKSALSFDDRFGYLHAPCAMSAPHVLRARSAA